ncbi:SURF1 family protein [Rhodoferax sp. BLA1]|uniref:SURF1 family protein n=1 Tax=Rhodoferax sp. BLA1 TaxID=2576062 RepID=UPI0015D17CD4|nr:SURF1 family protein [Rhodoferax sp. BLA1]
MTFLRQTQFKRLVIGLALIAACLGMARLQWWRAETRGATFEHQQASVHQLPISLNAAGRDADVPSWHPVAAQGVWLPDSIIYLDNKIYQQRVGYQVLTALQLDGSPLVVLVNRGWVAAPRLRSDLPVVATPSGQVSLVGFARKYEEKVFEFGQPEPEGSVWQHVREPDYRQRSGLDVLPFIVLQSDGSPAGLMADGLVRDWRDVRSPDNPAWRHIGYAIMWVVFALMATGYSLIAWKRV